MTYVVRGIEKLIKLAE